MGDRVPLNLRVSEDVKEAFDAAIEEKYGPSGSYAGFILERELRAELDRGDVARVRDAVEELVESRSDNPREKDDRHDPSDHFTTRNGETTVVRYQVDKEIRQAIEMQQEGAFRSPGQFLEAIMRRYAEADGELTRIAEQVETLIEAVATPEESDEMSTTECIASKLGEQFTREDFLDAAEEEGIGTANYALDEYLPDVLEKKNAIPVPNTSSDKFIPRDKAAVSEPIDPSYFPYQALSREEKRVAIKAEALRNLNSHGAAKLTPGEGIAVLDGKPNSSTVHSLFRDIANESDENGFAYDDGVLKVRGDQAKAADYDNETALKIVGSIADDSDRVRRDNGLSEEWVSRVIEQLEEFQGEISDAIITNKIAREKYANQLRDEEKLPDELFKKVSPTELKQVKSELGLHSTPEEEASRQLEAIEDATVVKQASTDGGDP